MKLNSSSVGESIGKGILINSSFLPIAGAPTKHKPWVVITQVLGWVPVIGAISGIVRIVIGSMYVHKSVGMDDKTMGGFSILRGSVEVLTLGFIGPLNFIADVIGTIVLSILIGTRYG